MKKFATMKNPWAPWIDAWRLGFDVQQVVAARMLRLAAGGPRAKTEAKRMVDEKVRAFQQAQVAAAFALATGKRPRTAMKCAMTPIKRRLRANRKRFGG